MDLLYGILIPVAVGGLISLILHLRAKKENIHLLKADPVFQDLTYTEIETYKKIENEELNVPHSLSLVFNNRTIPRLTRYFVVIWNKGYQTIKKEDIDKKWVSIRFQVGTEIIDARVLKSNSPITRFEREYDENELKFTFDELEPNKGVALEILHTGKPQLPSYTAYIRNTKEGNFTSVGKIAPKRLGISVLPSPLNSFRVFVGSIFLYSLVMDALFILGYICGASFEWNDTIVFLLMMFLTGLMLTVILGTRRKYPKDLEIDDLTFKYTE